jgi:hypothetical protein
MFKKLYSWIAAKVIGKVLGGHKTMILGWTMSIIGIIQIILSTENIAALCQSHNICLEGNAVVGKILFICGEAVKVLRYATGQNYGDPKFK